MNAYYQNGPVTIYHGDCRELSLENISAIVTDPPYELGFMGKTWDSQGVSFQQVTWRLLRQMCLPGSPLLSFGGSRTQHRIAVAIEDAGWEIRDTLMYVYGSGFPKSMDVAWKMHEVACKVCGFMVEYDHDNQQAAGGVSQAEHPMRFVRAAYLQTPVYACAECGQVLQPFMPKQDTQEHRQAWAKSEAIWGEQSSVARWHNLEATKGQLPWCEVCKMSHQILADGSAGWLHSRAPSGDGPIPWQIPNEDGGRPSYRPQSIEQLDNQLDALLYERRAQKTRGWGTCLKPAYEPIILAMNPLDGTFANNALKHKVAGLNIDGCRVEVADSERIKQEGHFRKGNVVGDSRTPVAAGQFGDGAFVAGTDLTKGRFPANFLHDGSQMVLALFPNSKSEGGRSGHTAAYSGGYKREYYGDIKPGFGDNGSAARFYYTAKASVGERENGLKGFVPCVKCGGLSTDTHIDDKGNTVNCRRNGHPTVKSLALMEYLVKLVKYPEYNLVLDPFMGSGTTLLACIRLGIPCIGIDSDEQSCEIAARRCAKELQ